ncbi:MAG: phosphatidylserine decarboxylase family protein [Rhodothermales bacterium]|nr:phosphatidylserine decarboxylase family protein [Rhodothermales bacterium]
MFAREGTALILASIAIAVILMLVAMNMSQIPRILLTVVALIVVGFTLYFFRDPGRTPPAEAGHLVLAPADGKVVLVEEVFEPLYLESRAKQVSIFLSPLNVHVNRAPADGVIEYDTYVPGQYLVAWHEKASELNERSQLGLRHPTGRRILFKQIAGAVARRVVYHITVGDTVQAGDRFGIVKFGSRMDVLVPTDVEILVSPGDRVTAGETIIGRMQAQRPEDSDSGIGAVGSEGAE